MATYKQLKDIVKSGRHFAFATKKATPSSGTITLRCRCNAKPVLCKYKLQAIADGKGLFAFVEKGEHSSACPKKNVGLEFVRKQIGLEQNEKERQQQLNTDGDVTGSGGDGQVQCRQGMVPQERVNMLERQMAKLQAIVEGGCMESAVATLVTRFMEEETQRFVRSAAFGEMVRTRVAQIVDGYATQLLQADQPTIPCQKGIRNWGNTCFLNAVLQLIANSLPLHQTMIGIIMPQQGSLAECTLATLKALWTNDAGVSENARKLAHSLCQRYTDDFVRGEQSDAHTALYALLNAVDEAGYGAAVDCCRFFAVCETNCAKCHHKVETVEPPEISLSLPLIKHGSTDCAPNGDWWVGETS